MNSIMTPIIEHGFSMIEMAMVLLVFSLLMGGMLMPMASQYQHRRESETLRKLNAISETLYGFALSRGRLPCPDTNGDGQEDRLRSQTCKRAAGTLPWVTLAVDSRDSWGRPWIYRVTKAFADGIDGTGCGDEVAGISFALCSEGDIRVKDAEAGLVAEHLPAIVISQGAVEFASTQEKENRDGDRDFVKSVYSNLQGKEFDDMVVWVTPSMLQNRMVQAGRLTTTDGKRTEEN